LSGKPAAEFHKLCRRILQNLLQKNGGPDVDGDAAAAAAAAADDDDDDDDDDVGADTGPQFALHCVASLLLPTLQAWLRRPITSMNTACWDSTTVANFKHYTGLCVDLVVELVVQFTGLTFCHLLEVIYLLLAS